MGPIYSVSFSILVSLGVFDTILNSRAGSVIASVILVVFIINDVHHAVCNCFKIEGHIVKAHPEYNWV